MSCSSREPIVVELVLVIFESLSLAPSYEVNEVFTVSAVVCWEDDTLALKEVFADVVCDMYALIVAL